jgi:hypothetical protein
MVLVSAPFYLHLPSAYSGKKAIMTILLALDDTDSLQSRGTARLARAVADAIEIHYPAGVSTQPTLCPRIDPVHIPQHCAVVHVDADGREPLDTCLSIAEETMLDDFVEGATRPCRSDPRPVAPP